VTNDSRLSPTCQTEKCKFASSLKFGRGSLTQSLPKGAQGDGKEIHKNRWRARKRSIFF
jgi:hypothetical protein